MPDLRLSTKTVLFVVLALFAPAAHAAAPFQPGAHGFGHQKVCKSVPAHFARCHAEVVVNVGGEPLVTPAPDGYGPSDLLSAYGLTSQAASAGGTQTIAIVDAYDHPNAEADLGVYRSQFGLSPCTTANGCFRKVDQRGGTSYPPSDTGWAGEIALDVDMVSAAAPLAHILLVEADNNSNANLGAAVDEAVALGAQPTPPWRAEELCRRLAEADPIPYASSTSSRGTVYGPSSGVIKLASACGSYTALRVGSK